MLNNNSLSEVHGKVFLVVISVDIYLCLAGSLAYDKSSLTDQWQEISSRENMETIYDDDDDDEEYRL